MTAEETPRAAAPESTSRISLRAALIGGAILLLAGGFLLRLTAPEPVPIEVPPDLGIPIDTLTLAPVALQHRVSVSGMIQASQSVDLFAEQAGRVLEVGAEGLDRVTAGQLLMRLDPLPGEVEVARAEATLAQAKSELDLARAELERSQKLATNRVSSVSDLDRKQNGQRVALAVHRAAEASLRAARDRLSQRTLSAPFDGVLRVFDAEVGEYVSPGQRIGELLEVSRVRVTIGLRDLDVVAVRPGMQAAVRVDARGRESHAGTVLRVAAAADSSTRKFPVQFEIDNDDGALMPGMVASVDLELGERQQALLVPHDAVLSDFGLPFVYVVHEEPDGEAVVRRRRVAIHEVPFQPGTLEVTEGLAAGEGIATTSLRQLRDGSRVSPKTLRSARLEGEIYGDGSRP
ncbi:MAG: efflux RND transporter periplasmic adaptor subunit [Myxococcota bacterium]|nr:efflux RND transporter periplasmic adaptor subunit [Myxococcota bacterium]